MSQPRPVSQARYERTREEVAELKAARRAEIERRASQLDPPLSASILAHIPSFQAAIQIITPLDDKAWDLLKPRLLAQRADAEQREKEMVAQARVKQELDEKRNLETAKDVREVLDADWDDIQAPVRARIAGYADEIIRNSWDDGDKVTKDNSPKFAVEVLGYIRKRFYAEIAKDAAAARAAGEEPIVDPLQGPFTQKLTLENMKWIFDTKIKPHTEPYRKELFLCNGSQATLWSIGGQNGPKYLLSPQRQGMRTTATTIKVLPLPTLRVQPALHLSMGTTRISKDR
ncbi:putative f-box domain containing protein [Phaeoacremonium minimum UCRPA7]|uniref:Putative f-box domain containing protein n=1 Tax=Phaeoacremonium minimum (strain UCR-PA7) TaxID=1286976 RepID=R8BCC1_PHAM7|nr:putative f-box domain containing protein [Phaeoacremonium minimum UCRPA7]EON96948.1 putative f-box domain containing protein [Phaeoacremonium minimum UCRPA7]